MQHITNASIVRTGQEVGRHSEPQQLHVESTNHKTSLKYQPIISLYQPIIQLQHDHQSLDNQSYHLNI